MKLRRVAPLGIGALLVVVMIGTSYGVTSKTFKYNQPKTGYLTITNGGLAPDDISENYANHWTDGLSAGSHACFNTSINLPHKSKMKRIRYFFSSNASSDLYAEIHRVDLSTGSAPKYSPALDISNDAGPYGGETVPVPANRQLIDNKKFAYGLGICLGQGTVFRAARIEYTYQTAGD